MLATMMTLFVRLHYSYKLVVNSGDNGPNDDSICKIKLLILQTLSTLCPTSPESHPRFIGVM
jgi:hypothetical protein